MMLRSLIAMVLVLGAVVSGVGAQSPRFQAFEDAVTEAGRSNRPVVVDVWAPWCGWCHRMKREVYPSLPDSLAEEVVWTRLNRDEGDRYHRYRGRRLPARELAQEFGAEGVPAIIFLSPDGRKLFETSGFIPVERLRPLIRYVAARAYREISYEEFRRGRMGSGEEGESRSGSEKN